MNSAKSAPAKDLSPQLSAAVLDAVPHGLIVFDTERRMMFANAAAQESFRRAGGENVEDLRGIFRLVDAVTEQPLPPDQSPVSRALRGETVENRDYILRRAQGGSHVWIECGASPIRGGDGEISGAVFTFRNITERKQQELDLESSIELRDFIYYENLAGIVHSSVDGRILNCNDAFLRMLGYESRQDLLGMRAHQLHTVPEQRDQLIGEIASAQRTGYEVSLKRRDGSQCWAIVNVRMLDPSPGEVGGSMISTVIDITERKVREEDLRKSEQRFAAFMRHLPGVAFIKDLDGKYVYYNDASAALFDKQPSEMLSRTDEELWPSYHASVYRENDAKVVATRRHYEFLETVQHEDGPHSWLVYKFPIVEAGEVVFVGGVGIDITERQIMEQQLIQSRKMDALGLLAGGVAHDFNNLLTVISGYGQLAIETLSDQKEPRVAEYLTCIIDGARRASGITGQLLAFSRREVVKPIVLDLAEVTGGMEKLLRTMVGEHVVLRMRLDYEPCLILSDEHQIQQVVINLAVNARDAMPLGGELEIRCEKLQNPIERPGEAPLEVLLEVRDNGIGMEEQMIGRIFDPFFTSKAKGKGTGLGLSTVYGIVSQAKGRIDVDSVLAEGTTFRVYFPGAQGEKASVETPGKKRSAEGGERVLLVEDDPSVRNLARAVLNRLGYQVTEAESGSAALELWQEQKGRFDILLTDVVMPKMSGGELAIQLRENNPHLKVLFMSGYAGDMLSRCGVLEGQTQLLQKPFTPDALGNKLRDVLDA